MNRYDTKTPRLAFAITAVVMSLATMTAFVAVPSAMDGDATTIVARAERSTPVTISPARIDVVASRTPAVTVADASLTRAVR